MKAIDAGGGGGSGGGGDGVVPDAITSRGRGGEGYHLYFAIRLPPTQATAFTLDEQNSLATASAIGDVERALEQSEFKNKEMRVCISSTSSEAVEEGLSRHGADVMVYCGLGSEHYEV